jgi:acyl-CoA hydrolase
MDRAVFSCADSRRIVVTASVNSVALIDDLLGVVTARTSFQSFQKFDGDFIDIWIEDRESVIKKRLMRAIYTFVAVDDTGRPVEVPQCKTELEQERFDAALRHSNSV